MTQLRRWAWISLPLLALVAVLFPAMLQARSVTPTLAQTPAEYNWADAGDEAARRPASSEGSRIFGGLHINSTEIENIAFCAATGFAGGLTIFFAFAGWGVFRSSMPREYALGAICFSTAASAAGFLLGFTGFLDLISF